MSLCPLCGSFIDPGEPCCPDCGFIAGPAQDSTTDDEIDLDRIEEVLNDFGYDLTDLRSGGIDGDDLEDILDELGVSDVDDLDI